MATTQSDTVHVYDTWVKGKQGLLHFVMTTDEATALMPAKQYLASIGEADIPCRSRSAGSATASRSYYSQPNSNVNSVSRSDFS